MTLLAHFGWLLVSLAALMAPPAVFLLIAVLLWRRLNR